MTFIWKALTAVALTSTTLGCAGSLEPYETIELLTEVAPAIVSVGDTVVIRAIMRNPTNAVIEAGRACGPPVLFQFRDDRGQVVYPIPLNGAFMCPGLDYHVLEPYETDSVVIRWRVELSHGQWATRSGFRSGSGLDRLSLPVSLLVEPEF